MMIEMTGNEKKENFEFDPVDNPQHYTNSAIEAIDVIEDWKLGFCLGNAIKYIQRAGLKKSDGLSIKESTIQDLEKAIWYIERRIYEIKTDIAV